MLQRNRKKVAGKQGLSIDMYNNKISNFNQFKKNFPKGLVDKKNSTLISNQKDQSVGQSESVPPSMQHSHLGQPVGTARYALITDQTQNDEPLLQIYQKVMHPSYIEQCQE